jgi:hypothetical protein
MYERASTAEWKLARFCGFEFVQPRDVLAGSWRSPSPGIMPSGESEFSLVGRHQLAPPPWPSVASLNEASTNMM